jgi:hypothetical protein
MSVVALRALVAMVSAAAQRPQQNFPVNVSICSSPVLFRVFWLMLGSREICWLAAENVCSIAREAPPPSRGQIDHEFQLYAVHFCWMNQRNVRFPKIFLFP